MNSIITVIGQDKVGIVSAISSELARLNINILDVSQTIMNGNFTMFMIVDLEKCNCNFNEVSKCLSKIGDSLNVIIKVQKEEIFKSMYTI